MSSSRRPPDVLKAGLEALGLGDAEPAASSSKARGAAAPGREAPGAGAVRPVIEKIEAYLREISVWNSRVNLVHADGVDLVTRHVLDCAAGVPHIRDLKPNSIADVGSGGGFPGIILAIFMPTCRVTLVERSSKKCAFLRSVSAVLGLSNVEVAEGPLADHSARHDVATMRAVGDLGRMFGALAAAALPGGRIVAYKGRLAAAAAEVEALGSVVVRGGAGPSDDASPNAGGPSPAGTGRVRIVALDVPFLDAERCLVIVDLPRTRQ